MLNDKPLWPIPCEIIGATGAYQSGKTHFCVTICPGPQTKVYDFEKSAKPYESLGFERVDVPAVMLANYPAGYKPVDVFLWWLADVRATPPGKYRVIVADPVTDIERGLVDWVNANPQFFGHSAGQYARMSGLMWGDVKDYWKLILTDLAARCETFAFTTHLGAEFKDNQATGRQRPKGKDTLMELASLYLWLERKKDAAGNMPAKPSATVLKHRLSFLRVDPVTGDVDTRPAVPPRLPVATPAALRQYMLSPPDYENLSESERAPEVVMGDEERLRLELAKAEAERDAELARLDRETRRSGPVAPAAAEEALATAIAQANDPATLAAVASEIRAAVDGGRVGDDARARLRDLYAARQRALAAPTN